MKVSPRTYGTALPATVRNRRGVRHLLRSPLERHAELLLGAFPVMDLSELAGGLRFSFSVPDPASRHGWRLHVADQLVIQAIIAARGVRTAFEIGTFNGGTTRVIAEVLPDDGQVWTLDLPPVSFDRTQAPDAFTGAQVGEVYTSSPARSNITQLLADSDSDSDSDPAPYAGRCDLVLVDGGHAYHHGITDTHTAFELVADGGVILWDDFQPYWHGLVRWIVEAAGQRRPARLASTSMGVWVQA